MVSFRSAPSAEVVVLDLHSMPVRLWALEVATLYQAANDAASEKLRWSAHAGVCQLSSCCRSSCMPWLHVVLQMLQRMSHALQVCFDEHCTALLCT